MRLRLPRPRARKLAELPLFWQIFLPNAFVLAAAGAALALTPATISSEISATEALEIVLFLGAIMLVNLLLIRRAVAPVERLTETMSDVDPLRPGNRAPTGGGSAETVELARVFNAMLERLERDRRESGARMLSAQERERVRLARELHDEIGQSLTGLMLELDRAAKAASGHLEAELREAQEAARAIADELRDIVRRLRPEALDDLGLHSALVALAEQFSRQSGVSVRRDLSTDLPDLGPDRELVVYRVAQEGLTNIARHSGASRADLALSREGAAGVRLTVRDDGVGVDELVPGSGIQGMRERALLVGGAVRISSRTEGGTELVLTLPGKVSQ